MLVPENWFLRDLPDSPLPPPPPTLVVQVVRDLGAVSRKDSTSRFQFIEVNALRLPSPKHVYSLIYESLSGRYVGPQTGNAIILLSFSSSWFVNREILCVS